MQTTGHKTSQKAILEAELKVEADLTKLAHIRAFVRGICEDFLVPPPNAEEIARLEMATNEAVSNIIQHAFENNEAKEITIEIAAYSDRICIQLQHAGDAFLPHSIPLPAFDGTQTNGFGLYLISKCVDDAKYLQHGENSRIRLIKRRS